MSETQDVRFEVTGAVGVITLDRPKALNALTRDMAEAIHTQLDAWESDPVVRAIIIDSACEKSFCAGGDVVAVYHAGKDVFADEQADLSVAAEFFWAEYRMNRRIQTLAKPYVALIDGLCMGGGGGLSVHGSHRVMSERAVYAMPETAIGLFPDVGGTYTLPRCPGEIGAYLALTGARIGAADAIWANIATDFVASNDMASLKRDLLAADWSQDPFQTIDEVVADHASYPGARSLPRVQKVVDRCFRFDTVEQIFTALETEPSDFAEQTLETLEKMSPTSLKVSLKALREAPRVFDEALIREYRIAMGCMRHPDFYEGIRANLVEKDRAPQWSPDVLEEVQDDHIADHFTPLERELSY